jgi:heterodisulfide reductase subunit A
MAGLLKMPTDQFGFLVEPRLKVRPEEYAPRGIFVAGCAHWPSSMNEAILQGYGAASRAFDLIDAGRIERLTYVSHVDGDLCRGCGRCEEACQHGAIELTVLEDGLKQAEVIAIHCTGCGVCTAVCPSGAISLADMSPKQAEAAFEAIGGV